MNEWVVWIIIVIIMFGGATLVRFLIFNKRKNDYLKESERINRSVDDAVEKSHQASKESYEKLRQAYGKDFEKEDK